MDGDCFDEGVNEEEGEAFGDCDIDVVEVGSVDDEGVNVGSVEKEGPEVGSLE